MKIEKEEQIMIGGIFNGRPGILTNPFFKSGLKYC